MIIRMKCPYCQGRVGSLMGGLRQDYGGRQRLCGSCGTIWRMSKRSYGLLIGAALTVIAAGALLPYRLWGQTVGDIISPVWLVLWIVLFWPVLYHAVWKVRIKGKIG